MEMSGFPPRGTHSGSTRSFERSDRKMSRQAMFGTYPARQSSRAKLAGG
jgi:hypothetical protein